MMRTELGILKKAAALLFVFMLLAFVFPEIGTDIPQIGAAQVFVNTETELKDAINTAQAGVTREIVLRGNISFEQAGNYGMRLENGKTVILDLNGHTLSSSVVVSSIIEVSNGASLSVKDSAGGGCIRNELTNSYGIYVNQAALSFEGGTVLSDGYPAISTYGTATDVSISGGTIISNTSAALAQNGGTCKISGGIFWTSYPISLGSGSPIFITGGTFHYQNQGISPHPSAFKVAGTYCDIRDFTEWLVDDDGTSYAFTDNSLSLDGGELYSAPEITVVEGIAVRFNTGRSVLETGISSSDMMEKSYIDTGEIDAITIGTGADNYGEIYTAVNLPHTEVNHDRVNEHVQYQLEGWYHDNTDTGVSVSRKINWDDFKAIAGGGISKDLVLNARWSAKISDADVLRDRTKTDIIAESSLLTDIDLSAAVVIDGAADMELDLAGHVLRAAGSADYNVLEVNNGVSLTIRDSGGTGAVVNETGGACIWSGGLLTIIGGTYETYTGKAAVLSEQTAGLLHPSGLLLAGGTYRSNLEDGSGIAVMGGGESLLEFLAQGCHFDYSAGHSFTINGSQVYGSACNEVNVLAEAVNAGLEVRCDDFRTQAEYGAAGQKVAVSIQNTGNIAVTLDDITVNDTEHFSIEKSETLKTPFMPGDEILEDVYLITEDGLPAGDYQTEITVTYTTDTAVQMSIAVPVRFCVTPKPLSISGTAVTERKIYDGTRGAEVITDGTLAGVLQGDDVTVRVSAEYDTADAGTGKVITAVYALSGMNALNYTPPSMQQITLEGEILKAERTGSLIMSDRYVGEFTKRPVWSGLDKEAEPVYYYKSSFESDAAYTRVVPNRPGSYIIKAEIPASLNYNAYTAAGAFDISYLPFPESSYKVLGIEGNNGWYQSGTVIIPAEGYLISNSADGPFRESLFVMESKELQIYLKSIGTGATTDALPVSLRIDRTGPVCIGPEDGIKIQDKVWREVLRTITFGMFLKETTLVTIQAQDAESGIAEYEYLISDGGMTYAQLYAQKEWEQGNTCYIDTENAQENVVYAKITNGAGLVTYLSSDGVVYDTQSPVISGAADGATLYEEKAVLQITDEYLTEVSVNGVMQNVTGRAIAVELPAGIDSRYTVIAEDAAGNRTSITVAVREPWMQDGITAGKQNLQRGVAYKFGSGNWRVDKDSTVYRGGNVFYALSDGEYEFIQD